MENFSMRVLPPPKNYSGDRVIDTLSPSHGSADPAKPALSPYPEKRTSHRYIHSHQGLLVLLLCLVLAAALPIPAVSAAFAEEITLGSGVVTVSNQVYFGTYNDSPVLWRVMGTGNAGSGMLLLSDKILASIQFNPYENPSNVWYDYDSDSDTRTSSAARNWCGDFFNNHFTEVEKLAVIETSKTDAAYRNFGTSSLNKEHVFFLSAKEADELFANDNDRKASGAGTSYWWLRSPHVYYSYEAGEVHPDGGVRYGIVSHNDGARPAFNLNLTSVLFSSEIPQSSNQYKLTLKDENLSISITDGEVVKRNGSTITIPYTISGTNAGSDTKAYVMVTDKAYTASDTSVLYYAALATGGTGTFTIDSSWGTNYKVYLLAVNEGGEKKTDTASTPVEITIPKSDQTVTAPTAVSPLTYTGSTQTLVNAAVVTDGNTDAGSISYSLDNNTWSTALPQGTDAKTYSVYYKVAGNDSYNEYVGPDRNLSA